MKVQEKIRSMRESKNWSQEEMATKLNMSVNGYSKIQRGEINPHIEHKNKIIDLQKREIARLEEIIVLVKSAGNG